jgi:hypothetical protein
MNEVAEERNYEQAKISVLYGVWMLAAMGGLGYFYGWQLPFFLLMFFFARKRFMKHAKASNWLEKDKE